MDCDLATGEDVAADVGHLVDGGRKPSAIERAISGISAAYRAAARTDTPAARIRPRRVRAR